MACSAGASPNATVQRTARATAYSSTLPSGAKLKPVGSALAHEPQRRAGQDVRERQRERDGDGSEHGGFDQELADDAPPPGSDRHAHGDFRLSRGGSREQQIRDVRAREQQHGTEGRERERERQRACCRRSG